MYKRFPNTFILYIPINFHTEVWILLAGIFPDTLVDSLGKKK